MSDAKVRDVAALRRFVTSDALSTVPSAGEQTAVLIATATELALEAGYSPREIVAAFSVAALIHATYVAERKAASTPPGQAS